jgi:hypothetical protein
MKKQLLNESEVRAFMKFANIEPLAGNFIEKLNEKAETTPIVEQDEEDLDDVEASDEAGLGDMEASGEGEEELDVEIGPEDDAAGGNEEAVIAGVKQTIDGLKTTFDAAGLGHLSDLFEVQDAGAMDMDMSPEGEADEAGMPPSPDEDEAVGALPPDDEVVSEVARRVARRLASLQRG